MGTPMRLHAGVAITESEAAVVLVEHRLLAPTGPPGQFGHSNAYDSLVHSILRPSADIDAVSELLATIARDSRDEDPLFLIFPDGQGTSLHMTLGQERRLNQSSSYGDLMRQAGHIPFISRRWPFLFRGRGVEQQKLLDRLANARRLGLLHFASGLKHRAAMDKALASYSREARDDRHVPVLIGALAMALYDPRTGGEPRVLGQSGEVYPSVEAAKLAGTGVWY